MTSHLIFVVCLATLCITACKSAPEPRTDVPASTSQVVPEEAAQESAGPEDSPKKSVKTNSGRIKLFDGEEATPSTTEEDGDPSSIKISYGGDDSSPSPDTPDNSDTQQEDVTGEDLFRRAGKKALSGDHEGAIADCQLALAQGQSACHRIMGASYDRLGDREKACASFASALALEQDDASDIKSQMTELECP